MQRFNDIAKDKYNSIANDNGVLNKPSNSGIDAAKVDLIAHRLVEKFHASGSWEFYCFVAWNLSEHAIDQLIETSWKYGLNKGALFNYLARKELSKRGVPLSKSARAKFEKP